MPVVRFQMPDGRVARFEVPEGTTPEQAQSMISQSLQEPEPQEQQPPKGMYPGEGILRGVYDPFTGLAQSLYNVLPRGVQRAGDRLNDFIADKTGLIPKIGPDGFNRAIATNEADYQNRRGGGIDTQRIAGNVISPVNAAIALKAPAAASLAQRIVQGAGIGSTQAMTMPVTDGDFWAEKAGQGKLGAAVGGTLPVLAGGIARVVSPRASVNPDIALLRSRGVEPTIGQALGGVANKAEQKLTSALGVGDSISTARANAQNQFNRAVINDVVESVGGKVDATGREGVRRAGEIVSQSYDDAISGLRGVTLDNHAQSQLASLKALAGNMSEANSRQFDRIMNNVLTKRLSPKQGMAAETFKIVDSDLGKKAAEVSDNELKNALKEARRILREQAARQNPQYAKALHDADLAYAKLVRLEDAAKRSAVGDGVFTPGQYLGAVKGNAALVRGRDFSRGTAMGQKFGEAGQRVLGNTVPDSGTAGRVMPFVQGAGALANLPVTVTATLAGMGAYTPAMQRALVAAATRRGAGAPIAAEEIRKLAPILNPLGVGLLNGRP